MRKIPRYLAMLLAALCTATLCACPPAWAAERPEPKHYLVLGTDYYGALTKATAIRTDTVLMVTLDPGGNRIIFTSILRDCKVTTPGGGENKLNSVYANYGFSGVKSTIERHLGVRIEGSVTIDFETVKQLIDAFGGVDIEISLVESRWIKSILLGDDPNMPDGPGKTHMTGRIALAYMRDRRSGGSDFSRTQHQRNVLTQLMRKASSLSLSEMLHIYNTLRGNIGTDLDSMQLLNALQTAYKLMGAQVVEHRVPADRTFAYGTLRGSSVLNVRWNHNREILQELLYPAEPLLQPAQWGEWP